MFIKYRFTLLADGSHMSILLSHENYAGHWEGSRQSYESGSTCAYANLLHK